MARGTRAAQRGARLRLALHCGVALAALQGGIAHTQVTSSDARTVVNGPSTDQVVTTSNVSGQLAVNRFGVFQQAAGDKTTLILPDGTKRLINLVDTASVRIDGTLVSRLGSTTGAVGGDILFAAPGGLIVGASGKVYTGRLTVVSANAKDTADAIFDGSRLRDDADSRLLKLAPDGATVRIDGQVIAPGGVDLRGATVQIGATGLVQAGAGALGALQTAGLVNQAILQNASGLTVADGAVVLTGGEVTLEGAGGSGARLDARPTDLGGGVMAAGGVSLTAPTITLGQGSRIVTWDQGATAPAGSVVTIKAAQTGAALGGITTLGGMPSANAQVALNGTIQAAAIDVSATATARTDTASFEIPVLAANTVITTLGDLSGIGVGVAKATGIAGITVGDGASLTAASGDLKLSAKTDVAAVADPGSLPFLSTGTGTVAKAGFGFVYSDLKSDASVTVGSNAKLAASGGLTLEAANLALNQAGAEGQSRGQNAVGLAVAVGLSDVKARTSVGSGTTLDAGGAVSVTARNQAAYELTAAVKVIEGGRAGGAVAVGYQDMAATTAMNGRIGSVTAPTGVTLAATNDVTRNIQSAETTVATGLADRASALLTDAAYQKISDGLFKKYLGSSLPGRAAYVLPSEVDPTTKAAGAVSVAIGSGSADATLGAGASIVANGQTSITADSRQGIVPDEHAGLRDGVLRNNAASKTKSTRDIDGVATNLSAAIGLTLSDLSARAIVGEGASVTSGALTVAGNSERNYTSDWTTPAPDATIDGVGNFVSRLANNASADAGIVDGFVSSGAGALAGSEGAAAIAGSVAFSGVRATTRAWIDSGAQITLQTARLAGGATLPDLIVRGTTRLEGVQLAGPVSLTGLGTSAGPGSTGAGGAAGISLWDPSTRSGIGDGVVVTTPGSVAVNSDTRIKSVIVAPLAGGGGGVGFTGTAAINVVDGDNHASISNAANVRADTGVSVDATSDLLLWAAAGSLALSSGTVSGGSSGSVGIGLATNVALLDTSAVIADNNADDDSTRTGTRALAADGRVASAGEVKVTAATTGQAGALAVAGSYAGSSDGQPGIMDKIKSKLAPVTSTVGALKDFALSSLSAATGQALLGSRDIGGVVSTAAPGGPTSAFAVAGSATVSYTQLGTTALVKDAHVTGIDPAVTAGKVTVAAGGDIDLISATGGMAISKQSGLNVNQSTTLSGAFGVQYSQNATAARIIDSQVSGKNAVEVGAVSRGLRVGAALSLSADIKSPTGSVAAAGSVSVSKVADTALAEISGGTVTAPSAAPGDHVSVSALNQLTVGSGAGGITANGRTSAGAVVSVIDASGANGVAAAEAAVRGTIVRNFGHMAIVAKNHGTIVGAGAMGAINTQSGGNAFVGAVVANTIDQDAVATLTVKDAGDGAAAVQLSDQLRVSAGDAVADAPFTVPGAATRSSDLGGSWRTQLDLAPADLDLDPAAPATLGVTSFDAGARVFGVAGAVGVATGGGGNAAGLSVAFNRIDNDQRATIAGVGANAAIKAGSVGVTATDASEIMAIAAGASVSTGQFAGLGSATINLITGSARAGIAGDTGPLSVTTSGTGDVAVRAKTAADIWSFAGNAAISSKVAGGAAVAVNEIRTDAGATPGVSARLDKLAVATGGTVTVSSDIDGAIKSAAATGAVSYSGGVAIAGAVAANTIGSEGIAHVGDSTITPLAGGARPGMLIAADNRAAIDALALGVGVATGAGGAGAALAINRILPTIGAELSGGTLTTGALGITAGSNASIRTLAAGVGVGAQIGGAGSGVVNMIDTDVAARLGTGAQVDASGSVGVLASQRDTIESAAGAVGIGAEAAGIGVAFTVNAIQGDTSATIGDADGPATSVTATGGGTPVAVASGILEDTLPGDNALASFQSLTMDQTTADVRGVAVNASAGHRIRSTSLSVGGGGYAGGGANGDFSLIGGTTQALVTHATVTTNATGADAAAGLDVRASTHGAIGSAVVAAAGSGGVALSGASSGSRFATETKAVLSDATVTTAAAGTVNLLATGSQTVGTLVLGAAGGPGALGIAAATVGFGGAYSARIEGASLITADTLAVNADGSASTIAGGLGAAGGTFAGGGGLVVVDNTIKTEAVVGDTDARKRTKVDARNIGIAAKSTLNLGAYAAAGAAGVNGGAAAGTILLHDATTQALVRNADLARSGGKANQFTLTAQESLKASLVGGAGAGGATAGVGLGLTILSAQSDVLADVVDSTVKASTVKVDARTAGAVDSLLISSGIGGSAGVSAAVSLIQFGSGDSGSFFTDDQIGGGNGSNSSLTDLTGRVGASSAVGYAPLTGAEKSGLTGVQGTTVAGAITQPGAHRVAASVRDTGAGKTTIDGETVTIGSGIALTTLARAPSVAGGTVGVAGTANIVRVYTNAEASDGAGTRISAANVSLSARADEQPDGVPDAEPDGAALDLSYPGSPRRAAEAYSVLGTAGAGAAAAAYSDAKVAAKVQAAALGTLVGGSTGTLSVTARDATEVGAQTLAVQAAGVGLNGSIATAVKESTVDAAVSGSATGFGTVTIGATEAGRADAHAVAGSGGILGSGNAAVALASNAATTRATIGEGARVQAGSGGLTLSAESAPVAAANAYGVTIAGNIAAGASVAEARLAPTVLARVGEGADLSGAGALAVSAKLAAPVDAGQGGADARATAGTGGFLAGATVTDARALNDAIVKAQVGTDLTGTASGAAVKLPSGALTIAAERNARQLANSTGITAAGLLAVGASYVEAATTGEATAELGAANGSARGGAAAAIRAVNVETNAADALAGSGGIAAGAAAIARTSSDTDTRAAFGATGFAAGTFELTANSQVTAAGGANAVNAAVVGASGADTRNTISGTTTAEIGGGAMLAANLITIDAFSNPILGNGASGYAAQGGSGGLANGAGATATNVVDLDTTVKVGTGAILLQRVAADQDSYFNDLGVRINAHSELGGGQTVRLDAFGLIQVPIGNLRTDAQLDNLVSVGDTATIDAQRGVGFGALTNASYAGLAVTKVYGGASYGTADADLHLTANQNVALGSAKIATLGDVRIAAGTDADGRGRNVFAMSANSEVFNFTAVPLNTHADVGNTADIVNQVTLGNGADVKAGRDIFVSASNGGAALVAKGVGHNPYLEAVGQVEYAGEPHFNASGLLSLDGAALTAGAFANRTLTLTRDSNNAIKATATGIDLNNPAALTYVSINPNASINLTASIDQQLATLQAALGGPDGDTAQAQIDQLKQIRDNIRAGALASIAVGPIFASGGSISLDVVGVLATRPSTITANGKADVKISNQTDRSLILDRILVPMKPGGDINNSGIALLGSAANLTLTANNPDATGAVTITNGQINASNNPVSDVIFAGNVSNVGGTVDVKVAQGGLIQLATVEAGSYSADVPNGPLVANDPHADWIKDVPINLWYGHAGVALDRLGAEEAINYVASVAGLAKGWAPADIAKNFLIHGFGAQTSVIWETNPNGGEGPSRLWNDGNLWGDRGYEVSYPASSPSQDGTVWSKLISYRDPTFTAAGTVAASPGTAAIRAKTLLINANWVNLSGPIVVGTPNQKSVQILAAADTYVQQQLAANPRATEIVIPKTVGNPFNQKTLLSTLASGDELVNVTFVVTPGQAQAGYYVVSNVNAGGGGFASITGKIANTNHAGTGTLTVLDGLGDVRVDNLTTAKLVVGDVNVGKSPVGTVIITDRNYADPLRTEYRHVRGDGITVTRTQGGVETVSRVTGDSTSYAPMSGIRYNWTEQRELSRSVSDLSAKDPPWHEERADDWTWGSYNSPANAGFALGNAAGEHPTAAFQQAVSFSSLQSQRQGFIFNENESNQFVWSYEVPHDVQVIVDTSVKADYPIGINFAGASQGQVNLKTTGDLLLTGRITNPLGTTSLTAGGGISQAAGAAVETTGLTVSAGTDLGSAGQAFLATASGALTINAGGLVNLTLGGNKDAQVSRINAGGDVTLTTIGSILVASGAGDTQITGRNITLSAASGAIGSAERALVVHGIGTADANGAIVGGLVNALARDGVNLKDVTGDLRVGRIEATAGDVALTASKGSIVAGGDTGAVDQVEAARLAAVWDAADIRQKPGSTADQIAINAIEGKFTRDYAEYRNLVAGSAASDAGRHVTDAGLGIALQVQATQSLQGDFTLLQELRQHATIDAAGKLSLSATQADYFRAVAEGRLGRRANVNGALTADDIAGAIQGYYNEVAGRFTAVLGKVPASAAEIVVGTAEVDRYASRRFDALTSGFTDLFGQTLPFDGTAAYTLTIAKDSPLYNRFTTGSTWQDNWLDISVSKNALIPVANTQFLQTSPQVIGRKVTLDASGAIGASDAPVQFAVAPGVMLTNEQKAALVAAGPGDVVEAAAAAGGGRTLTVSRDRLLQVKASGGVTAKAGTTLFLGGKDTLNLDSATAAGNVRLVTSGDLLATGAAATTVTGDTLRVEASGGAIGTAARPVVVDVREVQVARAATDLNLQAKQDLAIGNVFAGGTARLTAADGAIRSIFADDDVLHLQATQLSLTARNGIGSAANALRVAGSVDAAASKGGVYLSSPAGTLVVTGASGQAVQLGAHDDLTLTGAVNSSGALGLSAGGALALGNGSTTRGATVALTADGIVMAEGSSLTATEALSVSAARDAVLRAVSSDGGMTVTAGGNVSLTNAQVGRDLILAGRDVTTAATRVKGDESLRASGAALVRDASVDGALTVTATGRLELGQVAANALGASGADVALDAIRSNAATAVAAGGGLTTGAVTAGDLKLQAVRDMTIAGDLRATGSVALGADRIAMAEGSSLTAAGALSATTAQDAVLRSVHSGGDTTVTSGGAVGMTGGDVGGNFSVTGRDVTTDDTRVTGNERVQASGAALIRYASVGGDLAAAAPGRLALGNVAARSLDARGGDIALAAIRTQAGATVTATGGLSTGLVAAGGDLRLTAAKELAVDGDVRGGGIVWLQAGGKAAIANGRTVEAGGDLSLTAKAIAAQQARLAAGGVADVAATGDAMLGTTTAATVRLTAGGGLGTGAVTTPGNAALRSGGDLTASGAIGARNLTIDAGGTVAQGGAWTVADAARVTGADYDMRPGATTAAGTAIIAATGDVTLGGLRSTATAGEGIRIGAGGTIRSNGDAGAALTTAGIASATLQAVRDIGAAARPLTVDVAAIAAASREGGVYLRSLRDLGLTVTAARDLAVTGAGALTVSGKAGGSTRLDAAGALTVGTLTGGDIDLASGAGLTIGRIDTSGTLDLVGRQVSAQTIASAGGNPLVLTVAGDSHGGMAESVALGDVRAAGGLTLAGLAAQVATIATDATAVTVADGEVGQRATFTTPQATLVIDRSPAVVRGIDFQLNDRTPAYSFVLDARTLTTDTPVVFAGARTRTYDTVGNPTESLASQPLRLDQSPGMARAGLRPPLPTTGESPVTVVTGAVNSDDEDDQKQ